MLNLFSGGTVTNIDDQIIDDDPEALARKRREAKEKVPPSDTSSSKASKTMASGSNPLTTKASSSNKKTSVDSDKVTETAVPKKRKKRIVSLAEVPSDDDEPEPKTKGKEHVRDEVIKSVNQKGKGEQDDPMDIDDQVDGEGTADPVTILDRTRDQMMDVTILDSDMHPSDECMSCFPALLSSSINLLAAPHTNEIGVNPFGIVNHITQTPPRTSGFRRMRAVAPGKFFPLNRILFLAYFLREDTPEAGKEKKRINLGLSYTSPSVVGQEDEDDSEGSLRRSPSRGSSTASPPPRQDASSLSPPGFGASPPAPETPPNRHSNALILSPPRQFVKPAVAITYSRLRPTPSITTKLPLPRAKKTDPNLLLLDPRFGAPMSSSSISTRPPRPPHTNSTVQPASMPSAPVGIQSAPPPPNIALARLPRTQQVPPRPNKLHSAPLPPSSSLDTQLAPREPTVRSSAQIATFGLSGSRPSASSMGGGRGLVGNEFLRSSASQPIPSLSAATRRSGSDFFTRRPSTSSLAQADRPPSPQGMLSHIPNLLNAKIFVEMSSQVVSNKSCALPTSTVSRNPFVGHPKKRKGL